MFEATTEAAGSCPTRSRATSWGSATRRACWRYRPRRGHVRLRTPTRTARTGSALTWEGRLNLRNARFARDERPLDEGCRARPASLQPGVPRHLVNQQEILGLRLLSLHNLRFVLELVAARTGDRAGQFPAWKAEALRRAKGVGETSEREARRNIFIIILAFGPMWLLFVRPQRGGSRSSSRRSDELERRKGDGHRRRDLRDDLGGRRGRGHGGDCAQDGGADGQARDRGGDAREDEETAGSRRRRPPRPRSSRPTKAGGETSDEENRG